MRARAAHHSLALEQHCLCALHKALALRHAALGCAYLRLQLCQRLLLVAQAVLGLVQRGVQLGEPLVERPQLPQRTAELCQGRAARSGKDLLARCALRTCSSRSASFSSNSLTSSIAAMPMEEQARAVPLPIAVCRARLCPPQSKSARLTGFTLVRSNGARIECHDG